VDYSDLGGARASFRLPNLERECWGWAVWYAAQRVKWLRYWAGLCHNARGKMGRGVVSDAFQAA